MTKNKLVLAFSGGLDTSRCLVDLSKEYEVHTCTVDTGALTEEDRADIAGKAKLLGAVSHKLIDAKQVYFSDVIQYLIKGNVLKGGVYPLSVGAERGFQAKLTIEYANEIGAEAVAHGSTGAGNDQFRFDMAIQVLAPEMEIIAPVRENNWSRQNHIDALKSYNMPIPAKPLYSINAGLWGTTIGGVETQADFVEENGQKRFTGSWNYLPDEAFEAAGHNIDINKTEKEITIGFESGVPTSLNGEDFNAVDLIEKLNLLGDEYGIGRAIHIGSTVLGSKGRVGVAAPGPILLIEAHRELEKIILTKSQLYLSKVLSGEYERLIHEGLYLDPSVDDIKSYLDTCQKDVTGEVRIKLVPNSFVVMGYRSPNNLLGYGASYGEQSLSFSGEDAKGFSKIYALESKIKNQVSNK
jgi:argininosuccinate synthase